MWVVQVWSRALILLVMASIASCALSQDGTYVPRMSGGRTYSGGTWTSTLDLGGLAPGTAATFSWSIDAGRPFTGYSVGNTGVYTPLSLPSLQTVYNYFAKPEPEVFIHCIASLPMYGISLSARRRVTVQGPDSYSFSAQSIGEFYFTVGNTAHPTVPIASPGPIGMRVHNFAVPTGAGYSLTAFCRQFITPFPNDYGQWCMSQFFTPDIWARQGSTVTYADHNLIFGLDGAFPYPSIGGPFPLDNQQGRLFRDTPGFLDITGFDEVKFQAPFRLYMFYMPPTSDAVWVPVLKQNWSVHGHAVHQGANWVFQTNSCVIDAASVAYPFPPPEWTVVHNPL